MESSKPMEDIPSAKPEKKVEEKKKEKDIYSDFKRFLKLLARSVNLKDIHSVANALKSLGMFRKALTLEDASQLIALLPLEGSPPQTIPPEIEKKYKLTMHRLQDLSKMPEIQAVLHLLYIMKLVDSKNPKASLEHTTKLIDRIKDINRRTLDPVNSRVYYFHSLACEMNGQLQSKRGEFFAAYRVACLRLDQLSQATILNILLRSYISMNEYEPARNLVSKTTFPESASNSQFARYLYYNGRIKAVQLEYTEAERRLVQALRKAPERVAKGFRLQVVKLRTIVELLTGAIPERTVFSQSDFRKELFPYLLITQSVRAGDLKLFGEVLDKYADVFISDKNYSLIQRLRHNVIKFGLRKISLSYSRISLNDICAKLHMDSVAETEYIVAKAIRDGVIEATINHEEQYLQTKQLVDIYSTNEPQNTFYRRTTFCLGLHNEATKALEYPKKEEKAEKIPEKKDVTVIEDIADILREEFD